MTDDARTTRRRFLQGLSSATLVFTTSFAGLATACKSDDTGDTADDEVFYFAVITDLHLRDVAETNAAEVFTQTADILNDYEVPIAFVCITGDMIHELPSEDPAYYDEHDDTALDQLVHLVGRFDMPVYPVMGNHDYYIGGGGIAEHGVVEDKAAREALFLERLPMMPAMWYAVEHQGVDLYLLNSMQTDDRADWEPESCGSFGETQLAWLEEQLDTGKPCFLFFHHPLALDNAVGTGLAAIMPFEVPRAEGDYDKYVGKPQEGWTDPIYALLADHADHVLGVFVGHSHLWVKDTYEGIPVMLGTSTGNSLDQTTIDVDGEEQPMRYHIAEVNLTRGTFSVYNVAQIDYAEAI